METGFPVLAYSDTHRHNGFGDFVLPDGARACTASGRSSAALVVQVRVYV
jgi:hypothetical protein